MFSRWESLPSGVIKRACKFLLKKKLGEFILGDIDLDQLDVQLSTGTIQLSDLALNVDFINQKLLGAAVVVKEGSIKSLSIKIPWKLRNCQIEVEELELVVAPFVQSNASPTDADSWFPSHGATQHMSNDLDKIELGVVQVNSANISGDVHEGVKTIANIVKWFLTSFQVRLKGIYVAFDPCSDVDERRSAFQKSLVLRIKETEFGTCVSGDTVAKLTNFVKFQEAAIDFLQMDDIDNDLQLHSGLGTNISEKNAGQSTTTILTGPSGGFSGTLNLSIPWKNGCLDTHKVDAALFFDSMELRVQPICIEWVIAVWDSLRDIGTAHTSHGHPSADISDSDSSSRINSHSSALGYAIDGAHPVTLSRENYSKNIFSFPTVSQERLPHAFLPRTHVIHNWVPESVNQEDRTDLEPDYDASIDQFFECFDGMRNSQANSGTSGIWNWTCSVFSAITVASNLASGSGYIPTEQHTETTLSAVVAEISVILDLNEEQKDSQGSSNTFNSCCDSYKSCISSLNTEQLIAGEKEIFDRDVHHLEARCHNVVLDLETYPQNMKIKASFGHIKVDEYYDSGSCTEGFVSPDVKNDSYGQVLLNQHLQQQVQGALPAFPFPIWDNDLEPSIKENAQSIRHSADSCTGLIKVRLLESFGRCNCIYGVTSADSNGSSKTSTSFSVHLPPFVLWIHFPLVTMLLNLFKEVECSLKKANMTKDFTPDVSGKRNSSFLGDAENGTDTYITTLSPRSSLKGNIVLRQARVILCFPSENDEDFRHPVSMEKFFVLEHSSSLSMEEAPEISPYQRTCASKENACTPSTSIHLSMKNFDIFLVNASENALGDGFHMLDRQSFSAVKILSVTNEANDHHFGIFMLWQKGPVTGPWMASRAWSLSTLHDQRNKNKVIGKGTEYSSVTTAEDLEETNSIVHEELILSSAFLLNFRFSCVWIGIGSNDYISLNHLLEKVLDGESPNTNEGVKDSQPFSSDYNASQTSILVECDVLNVNIGLDEVVEASHLLQKELEGTWNCFKLTIEKFELLSVSNIGGISNANFLCLNHGEGKLWGSVFNRNMKDSEVNQDLLLVVCRNSAAKRGDGEGTNALSFGSAGTAVTHLRNPESHGSYTSIVVRCGTVVAPGGRLDWVSAVCLFFSLPKQNEQSGNVEKPNNPSENDAACNASFFLDLVDVALSYEPHIKRPMVNDEVLDIGHGCVVEPNEDSDNQFVACLLAATSFTLSNHTKANSVSIDYNIQLQDVGFLICEAGGPQTNNDGYDVAFLQRTGYVKVLHLPFIDVVLRIKGLLWEVECSESHIDLDTCHDTTDGLVRLVTQLQQLYAPDVEDALIHLQSRWNTVQMAHKENNLNDCGDNSEDNAVGSSSGSKLPTNDDDSNAGGLLDEILENAFYKNDECNPPSDHRNRQSHVLLDGCMLGDRFKLSVSNQTAGDSFALNIPLEGSLYRSGIGNYQKPFVDEIDSPQIIESYYATDLCSEPSSTTGNTSTTVGQKAVTSHKDVECGKAGWYSDSSLMIVENHISKTFSQPGYENLHEEGELGPGNLDPAEPCIPKGRILLKNFDVRWRMLAGLDWSKPRKKPVCSLTSNGRNGSVCLELTLSGFSLQYDMYPDGEISVSKLSVSVRDFNLCDTSRDAPWTMVLGYYNSKDHPRESYAKAFKLGLETVRPDPLTPLEDYRLHLEFLPMRLHLDQSQLNFLISFFGKDSSTDESPGLLTELGESEISARKSMSFGSQTIVEEALLPFFQKCDVRPLLVRVDYIPRHFDAAALRRGNYAELLNLVPWKGIDLQLKHVCAVGVYGWSTICETVIGEWLEDISRNQVHKLLKGLAPIRSLLAVSSGTSKLVSLPVKSYRKDHKLLKGVQRGALAFVKSISIEAVGLGVHLAAGAHDILLQTEYILTSIPRSIPSPAVNCRKASVRSNQPEDVQQGIQQAYESLSDGLGRTASALLGTPLKAYQRGAGAGSALATAFRGAPAAAIAPVSASARAVHCTLLGLRNSLDPEHKKDSIEKYLGPSRS